MHTHTRMRVQVVLSACVRTSTQTEVICLTAALLHSKMGSAHALSMYVYTRQTGVCLGLCYVNAPTSHIQQAAHTQIAGDSCIRHKQLVLQCIRIAGESEKRDCSCSSSSSSVSDSMLRTLSAQMSLSRGTRGSSSSTSLIGGASTSAGSSTSGTSGSGTSAGSSTARSVTVTL
jgi:hypothetical protein